MLGEAEKINAITTLGTDVYLGTSAGGLWRYKETDSSWVRVAYTGAGDPIYALSAVQDGNGIKWLFVGGSFGSIIFGAQSSAAHNVVGLNLNSGAISKLGNSTVYGTDGPVHALKAVPWLDYNPQYPPQLYGVRCLVGGNFSSVAGISVCKSIAQWSQGLYTYGGWNGFSDGLDRDGSFISIVRGLEGTTTNALIYSPYYGYKLRTDWDGIWMVGALRRNVGSGTSQNIAKVAGSGSTWVHLGRGYLKAGCNPIFGIAEYPSMFGKTVCVAGTNIYFGGFASGHFRADGYSLYCGSCDPDDPLGYMSLLTVENKSTSIAGSCLRNVEALAAKGNDVYAAGNLWLDSVGDEVMFGKLSGGAWTPIPTPTDHSLFSNDATSAATTANYVYFAGTYCWRWTP